ncbi:MAG: biotin-dependent carboxyltransferase family protein [Lachnospiraceae bacterium]|nr:biotin-dependent carboxyltransferase family protein [Lachnospiraceae bacterium]
MKACMCSNMENKIKIRSAGALTTIQDYGRLGYQSQGFSPSGVVDQEAMEIGNILVGNPLEEAVLECTLIGPGIEFMTDTRIALTGADMQAKIGDRQIPTCQCIPVAAGDVLTMGVAAKGCRAYIAIAGGFQVPLVLGSKSLNQKCKIGGGYGRPLQAGDMLSTGENTASTIRNPEALQQEVQSSKSKMEEKLHTVHVIMGPQETLFTKEGRKTFLHNTYEITNDSNRMACKLQGKPIESVHGSDIISDGIAMGAIQVASNGQPIVMLSDRQTTGGYGKMATVISTDIPIFAQCRPGDQVVFQAVSLRWAQKQYRKKRKRIQAEGRNTHGL